MDSWPTPVARCRVLIVALIVLALALPASAGAVTLPAGFQETTAFSGLDQPMAVEFAADGRVFVAEKSGRVKVFDNLTDTTPTLFADLRTKVHDYWDRGLEGMVLHPNFPAQPYVYVHYVHDAAIGGTAPRWGDTCPDPPGGTGDGCVVSGRVSRLTANGNVMTGSGAGARRGLVHAVPEPRRRRDGLRRRRLPVRDRWRRRGLALQRLRAGREPGQPLRRPAGRSRDGAHAADRGGRAPARAGHAHDLGSGRPERLADPHRPEHRAGSVRQPLLLELRPEGAAHHRLRVPEPLPPDDAPRYQRGVGRRRRQRALGGDRPPREPERPGRQLRLAVLRGHRTSSAASTR